MRAGGGADAGDRAPAAARGWELTGARLAGVPGLEDERILAREDLRTMRNPPVASAGLGKDSEAWIRRRWRFCRLWPPVSGVPHAKVAYVSYLPAQKKGRVFVMLTEGLCRAGRICREAGVADRRRVVAALGESRCRGEIRASGLQRPARGEAAKGLRVSGRPEY